MLGFFGLVAAMLYGAHWAITYGLRNLKTSEFGVVNDIMRGRVNADIVISGSSRALSHYDPRIISSITGYTAYNIGRNGSQTDMQLAFLRAYLHHNRKPKLIIHNLDLFSFLTSHEIYDPVQYMPYLWDESIYKGVSAVYDDAWKWKYLPLYGYVVPDLRFGWVQGMKGLLGWNPPQDHFEGYLPRRWAWTGDFDAFRTDHPAGIATKIEARGIDDLIGIIRLCHENGIPLIFVYSPEYIEMQKLEINRKQIFEHFQKVSRDFNVRLWDFSDSPLSTARGNFYNSQHLNAKGAALFSDALAQKLAKFSVPAP